MKYDEIGRIGKTHGYAGALKLHCETELLEAVVTAKALFIKKEGQFVPLFIEYLDGSNLEIIKFESYNTKESARDLTNQVLYAPASKVTKIQHDKLKYDYLQGFEARDLKKGSLGTVERIESYPSQEMAIIEMENKSIKVPLVDAFIQDIDIEERIIIFELPEGLLEL